MKHLSKRDQFMGTESSALLAPPRESSDGRGADVVNPSLERVVRLAATATEASTAALMLSAGEEVRVAVMYGEGVVPVAHALDVAREAIASRRHRFICDENDDGSVVFVAAEPVADLRGEVIGALCVLDPRSRSSTLELRRTLGDLALVSLPAIKEARGFIESISPVERLFSFVVSTLDSINTGLFSPSEVMRLVMEQAVGLTNGFGAAVGLVHGDSVRYEAASERVASCRGMEVSMDKSHAGVCVRTGRMILCRDVERDPSVFSEACLSLGARSLANVPLNYRANTVGVLTVFGGGVNAFGPTDVRILEQLAMLIAVSVERSQSQLALRESESRYQALVQQTAEAIYFADAHTGQVLEANAAFFKLLGYDREELENLNIRRFVDHEPNNIQQLINHVLSEGLVTLERRWRARDGRRIDVQATISVIAQDGRDLAFVIARDVTQQKQAERARRRSERKYRDLFERANVPILIFRPEDEVVLEANQQALSDYGFTRDELIGRSLKTLTADIQRGEVEMSQILSLGGTQNFETVHYRKDGSPFNLLVSCSLIEYEGETAVMMFGRDISDRKRAERLLSESEARLRAVTDNALDLIGIVDERARIRYMAGPVEELLGFEPRDIRASMGFDNVHPDDLSTVRRALIESLHHPERVISIEFRFRRKDGQWRDLSLKGRNLIDQQGVNGILVSIRDVTERKQFEAELVAARDKAEEMARLKSAFLANMSHEIRTPLTAILGFADVLAREVEGEHREFVELIQEGGRRLSETLNSVLDLARLEAGGFRPTLETIDVRDAIRSVVDLFEPMAEKKDLALVSRIPAHPLEIDVDRGGFNRILQNLVSNAIKFTDEGRVVISAKAADGMVTIDIEDTGRGIDESFLPHLFDEFKQESTGLARSHEGTGLGLTITRRLVELMDGSIAVRSRKGSGSTFTLRFPTRNPAASDPPVTTGGDTEAQDGRPKVLVVEDNVYSRLLVERLLRETYRVRTAANADEAFALAIEEPFDVVLMDINLGEGRDGVAVMRDLRQVEMYTDTPMVALTAYAMPEDRDRFLAAGFDSYLAKPFTKDDLQRIVVEAIGA